MRRELWARYGDVPLTSLFLCWITGGHDWRYHLEKPYRMCRGCGVKEMRMDEADRQLDRLARLSDARSGSGYQGDHKIRLERSEGRPQVTVESWRAHCSCGWSSGYSTDRQTVIRKHAEHSPDAPDQNE